MMNSARILMPSSLLFQNLFLFLFLFLSLFLLSLTLFLSLSNSLSILHQSFSSLLFSSLPLPSFPLSHSYSSLFFLLGPFLKKKKIHIQFKARVLMKMRPSEGKLDLKVTDDRTVSFLFLSIFHSIAFLWNFLSLP